MWGGGVAWVSKLGSKLASGGAGSPIRPANCGDRCHPTEWCPSNVSQRCAKMAMEHNRNTLGTPREHHRGINPDNIGTSSNNQLGQHRRAIEQVIRDTIGTLSQHRLGHYLKFIGDTIGTSSAHQQATGTPDEQPELAEQESGLSLASPLMPRHHARSVACMIRT